MKQILQVVVVAFVCLSAQAQVNSGSDGHDGAFNPTTNTVINMADHPDGIYHYTSVNVRTNVTVTFIPNSKNTPVVWLVQNNVVIIGTIDLSGQGGYFDSVGGAGGPGGWRGGSAGSYPGLGLGPGGGGASVTNSGAGGSFGSPGGSPGAWAVAGQVYGNSFLLPLLGGSGGGGAGMQGSPSKFSGGGGGGAILIAASGTIQLNGAINASGGGGGYQYLNYPIAGGGSGGGVRLVASNLTGNGSINANGGGGGNTQGGGGGRIRIDAYENTFGGGLYGVVSRGFQPIILPSAEQGTQLRVSSIAGVAVSASSTGALSTPDAVLSAQQNNPIPIVVQCSNLPLNTPITVSVKPVSGSPVSAVGYNNTGTLASSTATVLVNMPRGGGLIYATAATSN